MVKFEPNGVTASLLAAVPDMVYIVDMKGHLVWWNGRVPEVTGYTDDELAEMDGFDLLAPEERRKAVAAFSEAESFGRDETMIFDVRMADGTLLPHEFNGSVLELDGSKAAVVVARDVTERRTRETAIRRQRDELETLNHISEAVNDAIRAVIGAATREELEESVCERLAESELYRAVWVARDDPGGAVEPSVGVGPTDHFLETVRSISELDYTRHAKRALDSGEVHVVQQIPESDVPEEAKAVAEELGIESAVSVPISHRGNILGVLCVYSSRPEAFNGREQAAFRRLGEVIGFAINAIQTERLLLSNTTTELTFQISSPEAFLASVSAEADGPCCHEWSSPVAGDLYRHYVTIRGIDPGTVIELGEETPTLESITHVGDNGDAHVFEVVTTDSLLRRLLDNGASPASIVAQDGETRVVAELPGEAEVRPVVEAAEDLYDAELVSKRELDRPVQTADEFHDAVTSQLSERQRTVLRHAFLSGYFSWPREATAEEVAETMDISSPTFHYHVRRAQETLVEAYFQHLDE